MRLCNNCNRITQGEPLFCMHCGSTYDIKLCPSRHPSPRNAQVCSQCGSREFSRPAPEASTFLGIVGPMLQYAPGIALTLVSVYLLYALLYEIFVPDFLNVRLSYLAIFVALCWWLYIQAVDIVKELLGKIIHPRRHRGGGTKNHGH